jgi:hypothetical protein
VGEMVPGFIHVNTNRRDATCTSDDDSTSHQLPHPRQHSPYESQVRGMIQSEIS